jgi:hypothetical protein
MLAAQKRAPLNPASTRQAEVVPVALAAFTVPLRLSLHWAFHSHVSRPLAVLDMPSQSREAL